LLCFAFTTIKSERATIESERTIEQERRGGSEQALLPHSSIATGSRGASSSFCIVILERKQATTRKSQSNHLLAAPFALDLIQASNRSIDP